jgi:quercetin dioxygenase-like cupin family protein
MKCAANRIVASSQATRGVEGYVFDGADGSQMAFWTCHETAVSTPHVHEYDEYMVVVEGCYTLIIDGTRIAVETGKEYFIPAGISHAGEVVAGTRTSHPQNSRAGHSQTARCTTDGPELALALELLALAFCRSRS